MTTQPGPSSSSSSGPGASRSTPPPPDRGKRLREGTRSVGKALWFVFSIVLYAVGMVFFQVGRALITLSRWEAPADRRLGKGDRPPDQRTPPPGR